MRGVSAFKIQALLEITPIFDLCMLTANRLFHWTFVLIMPSHNTTIAI